MELLVQVHLQLVELSLQYRRRRHISLNLRHVVRRDYELPLRSIGIRVVVGEVEVREPNHENALVLIQDNRSAPRVVHGVTPDGRAVEGRVVGRDVDRDIALLHAPEAHVPAVKCGDPYALRPGSLVFAVGHPLGVKDAVSVGVFQAVGAIPLGFGMAERRPRRGRSPFIPWVQADVRLAPGNSGGPIADVEGNVIGVAAMIVSGLALAVPAPDLERLLSSS